VARFVEHIGRAVASWLTARVVRVSKRQWRCAPRGEQVIGRGGTRGDVLQIVGGIGPAPAHGDKLPAAHRMIDDDGITRVRAVA
jgi:hypothetical protein